MSSLPLPKIPKGYIWEVEVAEKYSGVLCFAVRLKKRKWLGYALVEVGHTDDLNPAGAKQLADKLWDRHQAWLAAKEYEGVYLGND